MVVRQSSVFVLQSEHDVYLEQMLTEVIPGYERAEGLVAVLAFERTLVSYSEVVIISTWRSEGGDDSLLRR